MAKFTYNDVYAIDVSNGNKKLIKTNLKGNIYPSYTGKYLVMYDEVKKKYEVYNHSTGVVTPFAKDIPILYMMKTMTYLTMQMLMVL
jgi:hypothetical protein